VERCTFWARQYKSKFPGSGLVAQRRTNAGRLNFVRWRLIFLGPQDGDSFVSAILGLEY